MPEIDLLNKTELWVVGIHLSGVDLAVLAQTAARELDIDADKLFVTDVRDGRVVFDVMTPSIRLESVAGRETALLAALATCAGVSLLPDAQCHSHGILGIIGAPADQAQHILAAASGLEANLAKWVASSVAVVSTGDEVARGEIADTNLAAATQILGAAGYRVTPGGIVNDDPVAIAGRVRLLLEDGHGLILTTGGVGAEDKDRTIEALERLDPALQTAILASYTVGQGRHAKPHVRVACGRVAGTLLVALPGPTREVRAALPALIEAMEKGLEPGAIAEAIAVPIRALWHRHAAHSDHGHGHA